MDRGRALDKLADTLLILATFYFTIGGVALVLMGKLLMGLISALFGLILVVDYCIEDRIKRLEKKLARRCER